jgi:demethylmenaquinone methyltransferase/2-methoxy-6-polyprenyl-1,4-benzoquinol methylase
LPAEPKVALDVATGTAGVALQVTARTGARVVGIDLTPAMLGRASVKVAGAGMSDRVSLVAGSAAALPFADSTFDALTFAYLLRYVEDPAATLRELARVVRPGGRISSAEFMRPPSRLVRAGWHVYTRLLLPVAGRMFGRAWQDVGHFLGPSISDHYQRYPLEWHIEAWRAAGIEQVGVRVMSLGGGLVMWGIRADG